MMLWLNNKKSYKPSIVIGLLVLVTTFILIALFNFKLSTDWQSLGDAPYAKISQQHPLGTNALGQDIAARAAMASRRSIGIGIVVTFLAGSIGILLGLISGWFSGRWPDKVILWLTGIMEAIPFYLFVAAVAYSFRGLSGSMELAMIATFWTSMTRLIRAEVLRLKQRDFILAARAIGLTPAGILSRHILPNALPVLLVQLSMIFIAAIKAEVILSFLGLGDARTISWGMMIAESTQEVIAGHYMNFVVASSLLFSLILAISLITDKLQIRTDPRLGIA